MQDGAIPHIARRLKDLLRTSFGDNRVLSRHFHLAWPPRSPDLSPCDYWLWGYPKSQVYRERPTSLGMMKDNIRRQSLTITSGHALQCCSQHYFSTTAIDEE